MNDTLALRVLGEIMAWDDETARKEFRYLAWMASAKYDAYQDYVAGARFLEHLVRWLQQFKHEDRQTAWSLVRHRLVFISAAEMHRLVELFYPQVVEPLLVTEVSARLAIPGWRIWSDTKATEELTRLRRSCLFMGLSDGARLDRFRRSNETRISNEQVVLQTQLDSKKWDDMLEELQKDLSEPDARFQFVFLIDDFIGSGTSLLGFRSGEWKGKIPRFAKVVSASSKDCLAKNWRLCAHHYLSTASVLDKIKDRWQEWRSSAANLHDFPADISLTTGLSLLPETPLRASDSADAGIWELTEKYYDPAIETKSLKVGGVHCKQGFSGSALPLVIEHNTPNNSIALLWAESPATSASAMRPLFRRRQRHG